MNSIAKVLILSNLLMIVLNIIAINISTYFALLLALIFLFISLFILYKMPEHDILDENEKITYNDIAIIKSLILLWIFIVIITINSGLMYGIVSPAYSHHKILSSWFWDIPYIVAIYIMMKLPRNISKAYVLYVGIALIGFSFLLFIILNKSVLSYLLVDSLMLGALGIFDLFWWSIMGELLDYVKNAGRLLGIGLSANVMGIVLGNLLVTETSLMSNEFNASIFALIIIFIILVLFPLLNKYLSLIINDHIFLFKIAKKETPTNYSKLTKRENEVVDLLLKGRTYKMIAEELYLSENTVKTHVKNIYSKYDVQSKAELIKVLVRQ